MGRLFTEIYRERGEARNDDIRFRVQLQQSFQDTFNSVTGEFARYLRATAGIQTPSGCGSTSIFYKWEEFFLECHLDDLLDVITHAAEFARTQRQFHLAERWVGCVNRALETRNMAYEVDDRGGVHHKIDTAFQRSTEMTLACLSAARFDAARGEAEAAFDFLTKVHPDTKMAVLNIFLAAENVFKLVIGTNSDLAKGSFEKEFRPIVGRLYAVKDQTANRSAGCLVSSASDWVNACHQYRHGQQETEIVAPPMDLAIALVTTGADHIRWMVSLA